MKLNVREMQSDDIEKIVDYFLGADAKFLKGMGADKSKLPSKAEWMLKLNLELKKGYPQKEYYYVIWELDNQPVGHSNINKIAFGQSALMHLHLWIADKRKTGLGVKFLNQSIPFYFEKFKLKKLICEPFSENIAPNKTLKKIGFDFIKSYETIPGPINFPQIVNRYELTGLKYNWV